MVERASILANRSRCKLVYSHSFSLAVFILNTFVNQTISFFHFVTMFLRELGSYFERHVRLENVCWLRAAGACSRIARGRHAVHLRLQSSARTFLENAAISVEPVRTACLVVPLCVLRYRRGQFTILLYIRIVKYCLSILLPTDGRRRWWARDWLPLHSARFVVAHAASVSVVNLSCR